jgi:ComF family protein
VQTPHPWIYTTYTYKDPLIKRCIHLFKYYKRKNLILPLVKGTISQELQNFIGSQQQTILVPIPSPRRRIWLRGYNHATLITQAYSDALSLPYSEQLLLRARYTPQQAKTKHQHERKKNIAHAFTVKKNVTTPKTTHIILIDDTTTTGATLAEARKELERHGYEKISAITLAH